MHATAIFALAVAGLAAAQTSTAAASSPAVSGAAPASGCGTSVDLIIQNCLGTQNAQLAACAATDWDCMCTQITNVVTCYNNCPSDPNAFAATQRQTSYCNAAKQYGSSASSAAASASASAAVTSQPVAAVSASVTALGGSTSASSTTSPTATPSHNAMSHIFVPAQYFLAVMGLAALL